MAFLIIAIVLLGLGTLLSTAGVLFTESSDRGIYAFITFAQVIGTLALSLALGGVL